MKKARGDKKKISNRDINRAIAILLASTKTKNRPISLMEIYRWLIIAVNGLGGYKEVADRIGLSIKMLRQFSFVKHLHPEVQRLFGSRALNSVDAVTQLLLLPSKEQLIVAHMLAEKKIDTKDLRAIVQIRKKNKKTSIKNIVEDVVNSKTKKRYVAEFVIRENYNYVKLMKKFKKYITPREIIGLDIEGSLGRLILTRNGKLELHRIAKNLGTHFQSVIPAILSK